MDPARSPAQTFDVRAANPWLPAAVMLPTFLAAFATLLLNSSEGLAAPFWPANALVVALLLMTSVDRWWMGLAAGAGGLAFAAVVDGDVTPTALSLSVGNLLEILVCASLVRLAAGRAPEVSRARLLALLFAAGALAPACSATYAATLLAMGRGVDFQRAWLAWYAGDALGLMIVTPVLLIVWQTLARRLDA